MTIRLQRYRLRSIQRCKLVSTFRLIATTFPHLCQCSGWGDLLAPLGGCGGGGGEFIGVGCGDGGGGYDRVFTLSDDGILAREFRVVCRGSFRCFLGLGRLHRCCSRSCSGLFCCWDEIGYPFGGGRGGGVIVGAGDGGCRGEWGCRGDGGDRGRGSWRIRGLGDAFEDS